MKTQLDPRRRIVVAIAALVTLGLVARGVVAVNAWMSGPKPDQEPETVSHSKPLYYFNTVAEMTATSDFVIEARFVKAEPGEVVDGPGADRPCHVTLTIDEVLFSKDGTTPPTQQLWEWGWLDNGTAYVIDGLTWSEEGDRGYYFVSKIEGHEGVQYVNPQGRALIRSGALVSSSPKDQIGITIDGMTPAQLEDAVRQAAQAFRDGTLKPNRTTATR